MSLSILGVQLRSPPIHHNTLVFKGLKGGLQFTKSHVIQETISPRSACARKRKMTTIRRTAVRETGASRHHGAHENIIEGLLKAETPHYNGV